MLPHDISRCVGDRDHWPLCERCRRREPSDQAQQWFIAPAAAMVLMKDRVTPFCHNRLDPIEAFAAERSGA